MDRLRRDYPFAHFRTTAVCIGLLGIVEFFVTGISAGQTAPAIDVQRTISLFDGSSLNEFSRWLKETGNEDPDQVFRVTNKWIHITGQGSGYLATRRAYKNYQLSLEYKWGSRTDGSKYVRNSGVLLNAVGPDGGASGSWMTSIEVQLAQGCEGDLIVIRGKDEQGKTIPATLASETRVADDGRTRWSPGGTRTTYNGKQFWWSNHEAGFKELLDTRGRDDVASPFGQWTRLDVLCNEDRITIKINGVTVNEAFAVVPAAGKILLQNEGNEIFFRNVVLAPVKQSIEKK